MIVIVIIILLPPVSCQNRDQYIIDCQVDSTNNDNIKIDRWKYIGSCVEAGHQPYQKLHSLLKVNAEKNMFLFPKRAENNRYILNGDTLTHKRFKQQNFYPIHLKKGINELVAIVDTAKSEQYINLELCDSTGCIRLMTESMFGRMFYPIIDPDSMTLKLDMKYYRVMPVSSLMEIFDISGQKIHEFQIIDDNPEYDIPQLKEGHSYTCRWTICNCSTSQTFVCGNPDAVYGKFKDLAAKTYLNPDDSLKIGQILKRFRFLLDHTSRKDDWWWPFKIAPISYQLESIFSKTAGKIVCEPTLEFESYKSPIDGMVQRCVVFTPSTHSKRYPLIVMIRPDAVNYHDFFSCPQLARQWAINNAQMLCDKYGFIVIMPEGRMPKSGILSSLMENEILAAIDTMAARYPIDKESIFLHANCSGGERALQIASHNPGKFKAIGLYAPFFSERINKTYPIDRQIQLNALKKTPVFVQGDPLDGHSPPIFYKDLLSGMEEMGNPCKVNIEYHSGEDYNVFLIGEEALQFFQDIEATGQ